MRTFDYGKIRQELLNKDVINLIASIHEHKGKQELYIEAKPDILDALLETAKIQSTGASNRIEGILTSDERLSELINEKSAPQNRNEQEIAGYRDVLASIYDGYESISPRPNVILQLHRDLYAFSASTVGGRFKHSDNLIEERDESGKRTIRFRPVSAFETPMAMQELCDTFIAAADQSDIDPLILIPMFILDFLCIHPFNDGNGRMSRLLTLLLLLRAGYMVGKFISIEMIIEKTKETYYEALKASSQNWHEGLNAYEPFVKYYLGVILSAHKEFASRVQFLKHKNILKPERVKAVFANKVGKISKKEISEHCPDIGISTIESALASLLKDGFILKVGSGRATAYIRNHDKE